METSTPKNSPVTRKRPNRASLIAIEDNHEILANELQIRRLEAINKSTENRRRSVAQPLLAGLNAAQLAQHCKDCIKLSTENKINSKNAFCFLLIDVMAAMTKKDDSEISKNFQVASCTLDASVKIYGYRVDAVHTEAMKIAGGFLGKGVDGEAPDGNESGEDGDDGKTPVKAKLKKKRRKNTVVSSSTLNAKSESEALLDAVPKPNLLSKTADGRQLLLRVPKYNDSCLLMVEADTPCWCYDENNDSVQLSEVCGLDEAMTLFKQVSLTSEDKICAMASTVQFGKDIEEDTQSEFNLTQTSAFEFDMNASVAHVSEDESMEEDAPPPRLTVPCTGYDSGEEIAVPKQAQRRQSVTITDMKRRLSLSNMEYSMFDEQVFKSWAGPTYWKVQPRRQTLEEIKELEEGSRAVAAAKRTRRGRVKDVVGLFDVDEEVLARHLEPSEKTVLAKSTINHWKTAVITLADDYKYSTKDLISLFHLPMFKVELRANDSLEEVLEDPNEVEDEDGVPAEELEYCSNILPTENDDVLERESDVPDRSGMGIDAWDAENMVTVPSKVMKIEVGAFQRKKLVDIKQLKNCIWNVINTPKDSSERNVSFGKLVAICPSKLTRSASEGLSVSQVFNALLHLTNEKSLVLKQKHKGGDFAVFV